MKKVVIIGIIVILIAVSVAPSINANVSRLPVKSKLVETSVRIHRTNGITPYTVKLTEKESDEVDRIFDNLKVSLDSTVTDEEIDEIYDDAVESLYTLGMFPKSMTVEDAKQFINGNSRKSGVKIPLENREDTYENFNCRIAGETGETFMFDLDKPFWNKLLNVLRKIWIIDWWHFNLPYYNGYIGMISLGSEDCFKDDSWFYPSEGWVWTNGTNGVVKWNGSFYGNLGHKLVYEMGARWEYVFKGVTNFGGLFIDKRGKRPCYLGNAERVKITYKTPW